MKDSVLHSNLGTKETQTDFKNEHKQMDTATEIHVTEEDTNNNSDEIVVRDTECVEDNLIYNIPTIENSFDIDSLKPVENVEDIELDKKESDTEPGVKEEDMEQTKQKKNYMSKEQEEEFLKQFEETLKTAFPETYANFSF